MCFLCAEPIIVAKEVPRPAAIFILPFVVEVNTLTEVYILHQCCGSKYIEFGSGSRILAQFGSIVRLSILHEKIKINFREKRFSLRKYFFKNKMSPKEIFSQLSH